ncbi:unnamed protein product [Linum tenue]|uniref:EF-hand domain-containing protein n=1 Tax=Linum tenue TaxID=586396 RepID=A0AAV0JBR4_9ROSI|nr:unnamed protein product [Linum tenue]
MATSNNDSGTESSSGGITIRKSNGKNYLQWSQSVLMFITGKQKGEYLTGLIGFKLIAEACIQEAVGMGSKLMLGNNYSGSSVAGADSTSQHSLASRHPSLLSGSQEADLGGYKSSVSGYGGQYAGVYGSNGVSATQPVTSVSSKGSGPSALEGRGGYSPKFAAGEYVPSSNHVYGHKTEQLYADKLSDYTGIDRRQYGERHSSYIARDLQTDPASRYADSVGFGHQTERYDRGDQSSILRQEQLLKPQSMHSSSLDGGARPIDYLAARGASASRHLNQDLVAMVLASLLVEIMVQEKGCCMEHHLSQSIALFIQGSTIEGMKELVIFGSSSCERRNAVEISCARGKKKGRRNESGKERGKGSVNVKENGKENGGAIGSGCWSDGRRKGSGSVRHSSPVKDKRREYVCKVHGSCLVDIDRDYLSLGMRYPRLFVSPELSKVVVNWPKENLKLSLHTPVSFEHDFVEDEKVLESKDLSIKLLGHHPAKSENGSRVWNAKIILMSGVSKSAFEELSSSKMSDDRPAHLSNILRFALVKKDRAFMAIGGPWDPVDGGDPAVDDSPLIQTALRYAKDVTQLDLQNCRHWNRFLEIHYDRFGNDGSFSHKEVTVLFVPDLSECLPSIDTWRDQWLAHKKAVAERERELSLRKERTGEKKEGSKGKGHDSAKDTKKITKPDMVKKSAAASSANLREREGNDSKDKMVPEKDDENEKSGKQSENDLRNKEKDDAEKEAKVEPSSTKAAAGVKTGKKKIVKRIVKRKAVAKSVDTANAATSDLPSGKDVGDKPADSEDKGLQPEGKAEVVTPQSVEDKPKDKSDPNTVVTGSPVSVKTAVKKKIIKRVLKRKLTNREATESEGTVGSASKEEKTVAQVVKEVESAGNQVSAEIENDNKVKELKEKETPTKSLKSPENKASLPKSTNKTDSKAIKEDKDEKKPEGENGTGNRAEGKADNQKGAEKDNHTAAKKGRSVDGEKTKDEKKDKDGKNETRSKSPKEVKEKRKSEDPPKHPGLILQTKCDKQTMLYSLSLSLDSLLDYTDKDTDESTVELSLFAESLHEMLQYQMGCRLLAFLQKLRIKFVAKRNERKRQLEGNDPKDKDGKSSTKRLKTSEATLKNESDAEVLNATNESDQQKDEEASAPQNEVKPQDGTDDYEEEPEEEEEDPEEDPEPPEENDEEMEDPEQNMITENDKEETKTTSVDDAAHGVVAVNETGGEDGDAKKPVLAKAKPELDSATEKGGAEVEKKGEKGKDSSTAKEPVVVDKELLQAFRFFDRNRAGFVRVEDMRVIIHNLGKFLSHREVKELVQSALLESNTGRDDRILYPKLVKMNLS